MKDEQLNLLGSHKQKPSSSLFILYNGKPATMTPSEIFNSKKYNELKAVTFSTSSTSSFITKYLSDFKKIYLIKGLPNIKQTYASATGMSDIVKNVISTSYTNLFHGNGNLADIINHLSNKARAMMLNSHFRLRIPYHSRIHEKFYLLYNPNTKDCRTILGSANLSIPAMSNNTSQYEDLVITDGNLANHDHNSNIFIQFNKHFHDLYRTTIDYTSSVAKHVLHQMVHKSEKHPKQHQTLSNAQMQTVSNSVMTYLLQHSKSLSSDEHDALVKSFRQAINNSPALKKNIELHASRQIAMTKIMNGVVSHSSKKLQFKKLPSMDRTIHSQLKHLKVHTTTVKDRRNTAFDIPYIYSVNSRRNDHDTGLVIDKKENHIDVPFINRNVSKDQIRHDLSTIEILMQSISKYAHTDSIEYLSRAMEAILYGFTAVFLSDIRDQANDQVSRDIPLFFFIGGASKSGKTNLLRFIMRALGFYGDAQPKRWGTIESTGHHGPHGRILTVENAMSQGNVTPLPFNEISNKFNYNKYGENLIINIMGSFGDNRLGKGTGQKYPALMGVTNNSVYNIGGRAKGSRSYYISFGKRMTETSKGKNLIEYIINQMTPNLFMDFAKRFAQLLNDGTIRRTWTDAYYKNPNNTNESVFDFLHWSRIVIRDEYKSVGMTPPPYIADHLYDDNNKIGISRWRHFYMTHYNSFNMSPSNHNLMTIDKSAFNNRRRRSYNSSVYVTSIPYPTVLTNDPTGDTTLVINRSNFYKWIHLDNKKFLKKKRNDHIKQQEQHLLDNRKAKVLAHKKEQQILGDQKHHHGFWHKLFHK